MNTKDTSNKAETKALLPNSTIWLWLSIVAAIVAIAGNLLALSINRIYASLTPVFLPQALAQDIANLALIAPFWLILAALALRGSVRAYLLWLGVLTFTVYNYVIYTFSIPFEALFLLWVAVLGMSLFALIGGAVSMDYQAVASAFTSRRAVQVTAWFLIVTAVLFGFLWLSEDVPALLSNTKPQSVMDMAIPTNPVHILDLGFFLPAVIITGICLLKKKSWAYSIAPAFIVFLILTGIPILITPAVQSAIGQSAAWGVFYPIGTLTVILIGLLVWLVSTIQYQAKS